MGLDYSFHLYFKWEDLWNVLEDVSAISRPCALPTLIVHPDHIRSVPIEAWGRNDRIKYWNDPQLGFVTSIYFPADDAIREYLKKVSPKEFDKLSHESNMGLPVGCVYITVHNDLHAFEEKEWDADLLMIDFGTPGTTMSLLFLESSSIRRMFEKLLDQNHGVCGILNLEDYGRLIWLNGQHMDRELPDPNMSPQEIEKFIHDL